MLDRFWPMLCSEGARAGARSRAVSTVQQGAVCAGQLSYEVKIDLCEVNLTRVQLTETCKGNNAGARDQLLPGIKRHSFGFVHPRLWRGLQGQALARNASNSLAIIEVPTPIEDASTIDGSCASPRTASQ